MTRCYKALLHERARRANLGAVVAGLLWMTGCSLALDVDLPQDSCRNDDECNEGDATTLLRCVESSCEPVMCEQDDECAEREGPFEDSVCEGSMCVTPLCSDDGQCRDELDRDTAVCMAGRCREGYACDDDGDCADVASSDSLLGCVDDICQHVACEQDSECADRNGHFDDSVCEDQECVPPVCEDDSQCQDELDIDTAVCDAGRCSDPVWGCIGREDPREPDGDFASYELLLIDAVTYEFPDSVTINVCQRSDLTCRSPLGVGKDYDPETGFVHVERLPQNFTGYLLLEDVQLDGEARMPGRFFFATRPLVNDERAPEPAAVLAPEEVNKQAQATGKPAYPERGLFLSRVYDCRGEPAEGVTLIVDDPNLGEEAIIFYSDEGNVPDINRGMTYPTGVAGISNVLDPDTTGDVWINIRAFYGDREIRQFNVSFAPGTITHSYIYAGYE